VLTCWRRNLNPISIIILIPVFDKIIYPFLRRRGINFTPIKRIYAGFLVAGLGGCHFQAKTMLICLLPPLKPWSTPPSCRTTSTKFPHVTIISPQRVPRKMVRQTLPHSMFGSSADRTSCLVFPRSSRPLRLWSTPSPRCVFVHQSPEMLAEVV
jgi:hypothetical protein